MSIVKASVLREAFRKGSSPLYRLIGSDVSEVVAKRFPLFNGSVRIDNNYQ